MKQDATDAASSVDEVLCHPPSPTALPLYQQQFAAVDDVYAAATPRHDVIVDILSRDERRPTSGSAAATSQSTDDANPPRQTTVDPRLPSKLVNAHQSAAAATSSAVVSSPETGWRAISGSGGDGLWDGPIASTSVSSPVDGEPADVSLVAASPTVRRTPPAAQVCDAGGTRSCNPLATLMRLYGGGEDGRRMTSPDRQVRRLDDSPGLAAAITSLPVLSEATHGETAVSLVKNGDYIMRELNETGDDGDDGPTKSYVCHVCQYIGKCCKGYHWLYFT